MNKNNELYYLAIYKKLCNVVFNSSIIPESWLIANINPTYKNKGDKMDPKNFCPITILSCSGKLFTAVLRERLTEFSDAFLILNENQCAFRRGYSIIDNLFIIHSLFEILKFKKKKNVLCLYCI